MWVGAEVAALTPVQEAAGSRDCMPGMLVLGMLMPVLPSRGGHVREAAFPQ